MDEDLDTLVSYYSEFVARWARYAESERKYKVDNLTNFNSEASKLERKGFLDGVSETNKPWIIMETRKRDLNQMLYDGIQEMQGEPLDNILRASEQDSLIHLALDWIKSKGGLNNVTQKQFADDFAYTVNNPKEWLTNYLDLLILFKILEGHPTKVNSLDEKTVKNPSLLFRNKKTSTPKLWRPVEESIAEYVLSALSEELKETLPKIKSYVRYEYVHKIDHGTERRIVDTYNSGLRGYLFTSKSARSEVLSLYDSDSLRQQIYLSLFNILNLIDNKVRAIIAKGERIYQVMLFRTTDTVKDALRGNILEYSMRWMYDSFRQNGSAEGIHNPISQALGITFSQEGETFVIKSMETTRRINGSSSNSYKNLFPIAVFVLYQFYQRALEINSSQSTP